MTDIPRSELFRKAPGMSVYITGARPLLARMRKSDDFTKAEIHATNIVVGTLLVMQARFDLGGHSRTGTTLRNIAFEQRELKHSYSLWFGLQNAAATLGSEAVGSKRGAPGVAAHGIWLDKGTGMFGTHHRPSPGNPNMMGEHPHPFMSTAYPKQAAAINSLYASLGSKIVDYVSKGVPLR